MSDTRRPCLWPERCGSDGRECCHPPCYFSPEKRVQREHVKVMAQIARKP